MQYDPHSVVECFRCFQRNKLLYFIYLQTQLMHISRYDFCMVVAWPFGISWFAKTVFSVKEFTSLKRKHTKLHVAFALNVALFNQLCNLINKII